MTSVNKNKKEGKWKSVFNRQQAILMQTTNSCGKGVCCTGANMYCAFKQYVSLRIVGNDCTSHVWEFAVSSVNNNTV